MMNLNELVGFIKRRYALDSRKGFLCRMARFGIIGIHLPLSELRAWKLRRSRCRYIVKEIQGNDMMLNPYDRGISTDLLLYGIREPLINAKFLECLKEGMVCYDIGANIGYYALQEASLVGASGHVYAIEPIPNNCKILAMNIALNGYENVRLFNLAMGSHQGLGEIKVSHMSNMCSMVETGYRDYRESIPVSVDTIDRFILGKRLPDVVRMDTEGYEVEIVKGMKGLLESRKPLVLFIEIHFDALMDRSIPMLKSLKEYGFEVKSASYEMHPAVRNSVFRPLVSLCERGMGATRYLDVTIDDLMNRPCFQKGEVENLEVIFTR